MIGSRHNGRFFSYVGYTNNLYNRLKKHNSSKGAKYTKGKKWIYLYTKKFKSKSSALKGEYKLKKDYKLRNQIKIKFLINEKRYFNNTSF